MNSFPADVHKGDDRSAIAALLDRLCVAMDAVDEAGIRACFAFEQTPEQGDGMIASEAFCAAALDVLRGLAWSRHQIEESSMLIQGDAASVSSRFLSRSRSKTTQGEQDASETVLEGIYHDRLIRQGSSWKLTGRRLELRP